MFIRSPPGSHSWHNCAVKSSYNRFIRDHQGRICFEFRPLGGARNARTKSKAEKDKASETIEQTLCGFSEILTFELVFEGSFVRGQFREQDDVKV